MSYISFHLLLQRWSLRLIVPVALFAQVGFAHAQPLDSLSNYFRGLPLDSVEQLERATEDQRTLFMIKSSLFGRYLYKNDQEQAMVKAREQVDLAERIGNDSLISRSFISLGGAFAMVNDINSALKYFTVGLEVAERIHDSTMCGLATKEIGIVYGWNGDDRSALRYMQRCLTYGAKDGIRARAMTVMVRSYLALGSVDSAFYCAQQADILTEPGRDPFGYAVYQTALASVYAARKEADLAEPYFKRAIAVADSFDLPMPLAGAATGYARMLLADGRNEESLIWARKGFQAATELGTPMAMMRTAEVLADAFKANQLVDSAFAYMKVGSAYRDSISAAVNRSRMQSQLLDQELKDRADVNLKEEAKATRSRNIQFGIIALIVITLLVFLLAISRTSVVGAKTIKNLSLVALLLLFEFINLVLSPLLGEVFDQSPLLIMLAMVVIAGLLIPLHHRMERFITNMLVSKNNRVRLEAARRTIAELEARAPGEGPDA